MNTTRVAALAVLVGVTLIITYWASRRTSTQTDFFVAGRGITAGQNGFAIAGDLMSAATFLGFTGLIYLNGFDGWVLATAAIFAFLVVMLLLAERMRNAGRYTMADVLALRLKERPIRAAAATSTLVIAVLYLVAQLVGGGVLLGALTGISFTPAVLLTGTAMLVYVVFGGMLATTWVQIIKAVLLLGTGIVMSVAILWQFQFNPLSLFAAASEKHPAGADYLGPGISGGDKLNTFSAAVAYAIGTAALPHILIRFFTVPDARAARRSVGWAVGVIGLFFILTSVIGYGARALLPSGSEQATGGGNLAAPLLAEHLGGGEGTIGGDLSIAVVSAVALATILAVVAGLVLSASGAVAHDLWFNVIRRRSANESEGAVTAKWAAVVVGVVAMALTIALGSEFNVAFLVGLALSVAASANFPALIMAMNWKRFTTTGAVASMSVGLLSAVVLIILSPEVWPGGPESAPFSLSYPVLISIPLGFLAGIAGTFLSRPSSGEKSFEEVQVQLQVGHGAVANEPST